MECECSKTTARTHVQIVSLYWASAIITFTQPSMPGLQRSHCGTSHSGCGLVCLSIIHKHSIIYTHDNVAINIICRTRETMLYTHAS